MPRDTVGYTAGTGSLVETYPDATDGAIREATVITDPENRRAAYVTTDNRLQVKMDTSSTPVVTSVPISTTSVTHRSRRHRRPHRRHPPQRHLADRVCP
jgi:hypothetical protein